MPQTWAEEAVNFQFGAYNIGVMTDNTHSAQLLTRTGIGFSYKHPLEYLWGEYNECRMGATMESYLSGYGDPRLESYFSPAEKDGAYHGIPNGIISNPKDYQSLASCPKVGFTSPLTWMCAAEVCFLRAEGALLGWNMGGTAENLYNEGIRTSFSQWSAPNADKYLSDSKSTPVNIPAWDRSARSRVRAASPSSGPADGRELERIMVQKWIALYPDGQEAWSENPPYRVTRRYSPRRPTAAAAYCPPARRSAACPCRSRSTTANAEQVAKAVNEFLGGSDNCAQKLWWDAK